MGDTIESVEELAVRIAELCAMIEQLISRARDHPLPDGMQARIAGLVECVFAPRLVLSLIMISLYVV